MTFHAVEPRKGSAAVRFDLPAERLRMKGQKVRITDFDGEAKDYQITDVSMPDEHGTVTISFAR